MLEATDLTPDQLLSRQVNAALIGSLVLAYTSS